MAQRAELVKSISETIQDYRPGELAESAANRVERWINQFDKDVQIPLLKELDYVFKKTYMSRRKVKEFLGALVDNPKLTGDSPKKFWKSAYILDNQKNGKSQSELVALFRKIIKKRFGFNVANNGNKGGAVIYLDDAVFTGDRVISDLVENIQLIPARAQIHIIAIAVHTYAEYWFSKEKRVQSAISEKHAEVKFWRAITFENRKNWRCANKTQPTDVLRPTEIDERTPSERSSCFFSSVDGRQLLEKEFLKAGEKIQGFSEKPNPMLKPLGYSPFDPGFGSMFVTDRNCPNNCPLALWYGDPSYSANHPLGRWYPLFPRKTYSEDG